jgi:GntR family transcriptional regulator/MocR family aminotransferase
MPSLREQIYQDWREGILAGRFRPGESVPSSRELAQTLDVARSTVTEAYDRLIAEGYLETARGSGTFVCRELPDEMLTPRRRAARKAPVLPPIRLSRYGSGLDYDYRRNPAAPGVISFQHGLPDLQRFPYDVWRKLLLRRLRDRDSEAFDYTGQSDGYSLLREEIAAYAGRIRAVRAKAEQVIVVSGSQQALDLCARLFLETGDEVGLEDPGYQGAKNIFRASGTRLRPLPIDSDGVTLDGLSKKTRLIYVTPSHQYPTGVSMSLARRLELIQLAKRTGSIIVEDDYSSEYRYSGPPLPSLQGLASDVPIVYIGTFSKVMFPGLRIGYIIAPPQLVAPFARAKWLSDRNTPMLEQMALADFMREGFLDRHVRRMRKLYGERRNALIEALSRHFGDSVRVPGDPAGMHVLAQFEDLEVGRRAEKNGVLMTDARAYYLEKPPEGEYVLGFSALGERAIREGVRRFAK